MTAVQRNVLISILLVGAFVQILNQTLLNTALPVLMDFFNITAAEAQWVTTLFMLVNGIMIPVSAYLIGTFTTRQMFISAMVLFSIGTLIAALAPFYWVLLIGRILQAVGGGVMMPLMQTILFALYPRNQRGKAMGYFGLIIGFAPAIGPSLSGWILERYDWHALFWIMLPIALLATLLPFGLLRNVTEPTNPHLDKLSVILSTFGFGGLLFGFSVAGTQGWLSPSTIISLLVGTVALVWFIRRQLRLEEPLLELRVLSDKMYALNTILGCISFIAFMGGMLILPVYTQNIMGFSAFESGLVMLPGAITMGILSPISGTLFDRFGARWLAITGFVLLTVTGIAFALMSPTTSFAYVATVNAVRSAAGAMIMMPTTTAALNQLPQKLIPHGTAVNNTLRQVAGSVGTALVVSTMTMVDRTSFAAISGIDGGNAAFFLLAFGTIVGLVGAFFIRHSHAEKIRRTDIHKPDED